MFKLALVVTFVAGFLVHGEPTLTQLSVSSFDTLAQCEQVRQMPDLAREAAEFLADWADDHDVDVMEDIEDVAISCVKAE